jgi:hypothetical protein
MKMQALLLGSMVAAAVVALPTPAAALPMETFQIDSDHCSSGDGCLPGTTTNTSGGTITVTQNADGTLSFDVALADFLSFMSGTSGNGFEAGFGFNLDGIPTITYTNVTSGFTPVTGNPQNTDTLHMDGIGDFQFGLSCTGCGPGSSAPLHGPLDFTISATTPLTLSNLTQNGNLQFFGLEVVNLTTGATGGVDASTGVRIPPQEIPEPGILSLLGLGLVGLGFTTLRRRRS